MQHQSDAQLLREYAKNGEERAFAEIVARHTNLVYSAALRQVGSPDVAADVAQSAFVALARSGPSLCQKLAEDASIAGWLCRSARNISLNIRRDEFRRHSREREAMEQSFATPESTTDWERLCPVLDEAMSELNEPDYDALILRFFKNQDMREVGRALGVSDDAAQKRVSRALDKLRDTLARRGISTGTVALGAILSANAVQAAPVGLVVTISSAAGIATASLKITTVTTGIMAMTTIQKAVVGAVLAAAIGTAVYEGQKASGLRKELQALAQDEEFLRRAYHKRGQSPAASNELASVQGKNGPLTSTATESQEPSTAQVPEFPAASAQDVLPEKNISNPEHLPRASWADVGFATPAQALQTRGWAVLNGNRERFKESLFVTDGARQTLEDMFVKMAEASNDPNKAQFIQQVLDNDLAVEDGMLMPMMAEDRQKGYVGYRILSQQSPTPDETIVQLEIQMTSPPVRKENLKFRRIDGDWKVVIDEAFIKAQMR